MRLVLFEIIETFVKNIEDLWNYKILYSSMNNSSTVVTTSNMIYNINWYIFY